MEEVDLFQEYIERLTEYAGEATAMHIISEAIYIISIGTNDFVENYFALVTGRIKQFTPEEFEDFLVGIAGNLVTRLYSLGARKIAFAGLVPFGCVPLARTLEGVLAAGHGEGECFEDYNKAARGFNLRLQALIGRLCDSLPGLQLRYDGVYDLLSDILKSPSSYGFEVVKEGCCGTGRIEVAYLCNNFDPHTCMNADRYLFWDAIHPSEKLNYLVANQTLQVLTEFM